MAPLPPGCLEDLPARAVPTPHPASAWTPRSTWPLLDWAEPAPPWAPTFTAQVRLLPSGSGVAFPGHGDLEGRAIDRNRAASELHQNGFVDSTAWSSGLS